MRFHGYAAARFRMSDGGPFRTLALVAVVSGALLLGPAAMQPAFSQGSGTPSASPVASPAASPVADTATLAPSAGTAHYPDLVALPPEDLYFSEEALADGETHHLLRFTSAVANSGEGPMELVLEGGAAGANDVAQQVFDAPAGGAVVETIPLGTDLIYHPEHNHFHLDGFATYELLRVQDNGETVPTGEGGKQSSCLLDSAPVDGAPGPIYDACVLERQGISVGWMDIYSASLPDQWVDLGDEPLADGTYVLRYTVDPLGQIAEGDRTGNNVAETGFTVENGAIVGLPEPPRCGIVGTTTVSPGSRVTLRCSHFPTDTYVDVYWDAWDPWDDTAESVADIVSMDGEPLILPFTVPEVEEYRSVTVMTVAWDYDTQRYVAATVILNVVEPGSVASPIASPAASPVASPAASPAADHDHATPGATPAT